MIATQRYRGVFTIPSTPFHATGEADKDGLRRIVDFLQSAAPTDSCTP